MFMTETLTNLIRVYLNLRPTAATVGCRGSTTADRRRYTAAGYPGSTAAGSRVYCS